MLDTATKKRINDCRDILVGKLPDPKAQIEQITIGLIYKFMNDMDKESIELGGKAKFFADYKIPDPDNSKKEKPVQFSKYSWDSLLDPKVSAIELIDMYTEAIKLLEYNPNIPPLFRDIFKNAYLPYRDPETLKMFLKTIGEFEYTHSEMLGDAFEYLLSVMGSQGDAGQFRTPRHIIDFLVECVAPSKTDTILDPACGTAGFLISAYKHIKAKNEKGLTPSERKKVIQNFVGYDISPDMVRLSLVNLYLHGFSDPHIYEYDTLSSEDRWKENYDVILANPPFMSPKGGIRPHQKFTISSNRSEVLFVDYIAEHLNPKGRAGIIVPEGIIFQNGKAYKALRKMLVENYLYAVVSLPAGVFNPYSGVKTSILLMDKEIAKKDNEILFVKIDNDGYSLSAQRKDVKGGQLEEAIKTIGKFREGKLKESTIAHAVNKTEIAKSGDYYLSGDRYKSVLVQNTIYKFVELNKLTTLITDGTHQTPNYTDIGIPFLRVTDLTKSNDSKKFISLEEHRELIKRCKPENGDILYSKNGTIGVAKIVDWDYEFSIFVSLALLKPIREKILPKYLEILLNSDIAIVRAKGFSKSGTVTNLHLIDIKRLEIPLPPLSVQEEIVAEIEGYQKIIDGAKAIVDNYKPKIDIDPEWEMVELASIIKLSSGKGLTSQNMIEGPYPVYGGNGINGYHDEYFLEEPTIVIGRVGAYCGASYITEAKSWITDNGLYVTSFLKEIEIRYLSQILTQLNLNKFAKVGGQPSISQKTVTELRIAFPPIETQKKIVEQIEKEQELVNANKQLIEIFEQKIKDRIAKVWGE